MRQWKKPLIALATAAAQHLSKTNSIDFLAILKVITLSTTTAVVGEDTTRAFEWTVVEHFKGGFPRFYDIVLPFLIHLHLADSLINVYLL